MNNFIKNIAQIPKAIRSVFKGSGSITILLISWAVLFGFMFYLPVKTIPSNSISLQAKIFGYKDYLFLGIASFLSSLIITMQVRIFRQRREVKVLAGNTALGSAGLFSGVVSSVFGTASCGLCVAALFGFLGGNSVIFLANNRIYVVLVSITLLSTSLYFSSKRLNNSCDICKVD